MPKPLYSILLLFLFISCGGEEIVTESSLDIPDDYSFMLDQRTSRVIKGSEEDIRVRIGDITKRRVEVWVKGESEEADAGTIYFNKVMSKNDEGQFDYHGTSYTIKIEELINHLIGDDNAQIAIYKTAKENKFAPEVE